MYKLSVLWFSRFRTLPAAWAGIHQNLMDPLSQLGLVVIAPRTLRDQCDKLTGVFWSTSQVLSTRKTFHVIIHHSLKALFVRYFLLTFNE